jgi:hypothetical protein
MDNNLPIIVFDFFKRTGNLLKVVMGEKIGTGGSMDRRKFERCKARSKRGIEMLRLELTKVRTGSCLGRYS